MAIMEDKKYHSITEVCETLLLAPNTVRKWEKTCELLNPPRHRVSGNRMYRAQDIQILENILAISQTHPTWSNQRVFKAIEVFNKLEQTPSPSLFLNVIEHDNLLPSHIDGLISDHPQIYTLKHQMGFPHSIWRF